MENTHIDRQNIVTSIRLSFNQLTKTEKKIAKYVLDNDEKVIFMSITELADACGVAEASVHRFCRSLGVKGYQEFKMLLSISINGEKMQDTPPKSTNKNDLFASVYESHLEALHETNELLDKSMVEKTVQMMSSAERIYFFGVGNSMITAMEACGRFLHITPKAITLPDSHLQAMAASMAGERDVFIFFSYSGSTHDTIQVAELAKQNGAGVSVITRYPKSDLTKLADTVLICGSKEGPLEGGSMGAKVSQLHIIDVLFQDYYRENMEVSQRNNEATAKATVGKFV